MNAYYELRKENEEPVMTRLTNVLVEEIADMIQIHAEGSFMHEFYKKDVISEDHSDDQDFFKLVNGTEIILSFNN